MRKIDFINEINATVYQASCDDTLKNIISPPGRRPARELVELSKWYNSLSDENKKMVQLAIKSAAHGALFGLFCVVDGVRKSDLGESFEITADKIPLSGDDYYHDLFNARE